MKYHTSPRGLESEGEERYAHEGAEYSDKPHSRDVTYEGIDGLTHSVHHTLNDYGYSEEGLGESHETKHSSAETYYLGVRGEQAHHIRCKY